MLPNEDSNYHRLFSSSEAWYQYLGDWQKHLMDVTSKLLDQYQENKNALADYSFLVFSAAKTYEGFLKKMLFDMKLIDQETYEGRRFRIGRALNPDVSYNQRDQYWLYDNLERICSTAVARQIWDAWLHCRNRVFHFFPKNESLLSYDEAVSKIAELVQAMRAGTACVNDDWE
ncbi:MAG TPA: hypothetical protein PLM16_00145 [Candidatus Woesebacteria bacterium]|nr:hypothetical protein [Candidatus Woesebacteria bacterium]